MILKQQSHQKWAILGKKQPIKTFPGSIFTKKQGIFKGFEGNKGSGFYLNTSAKGKEMLRVSSTRFSPDLYI